MIMRRVLVGGLVLALVLGGFYVAWPAWSARQIRVAIEANDAPALERKIDFPRVRERVRPIVAAEMDRSLERLKREGGPIGAAIAGQLKEGLGGKIAEAAVESVLTPANVIRMVRQGKGVTKALRDFTAERGAARPGRKSADAPAGDSRPTTQGGGAEAAPQKLGLANIKGFRLTGPFALAIDIAHDPAAREPDITAELAFIGGDWKVVGLVPRL